MARLVPDVEREGGGVSLLSVTTDSVTVGAQDWTFLEGRVQTPTESKRELVKKIGGFSSCLAAFMSNR